MLSFSFVVTLLSTSLAALLLVFGFSSAKSAPQEASVAALACAMAIIPYVFTRCIQIDADRKAQSAELKRIADLLDAHLRGSGAVPAVVAAAPSPAIRTTRDDVPVHSAEAPAVRRTDWS